MIKYRWKIVPILKEVVYGKDRFDSVHDYRESLISGLMDELEADEIVNAALRGVLDGVEVSDNGSVTVYVL